MTTIPRCPSHGVAMTYAGPGPHGTHHLFICPLQHCTKTHHSPTAPPAHITAPTPMLQPILYAPAGMPSDLSDRARNWLFEQQYPAPTVADKITVPGEGALLVVPTLAMLGSRSRFLDLVLQTATSGGKLVVIDPMIDLRGLSPASAGQRSALFPLSQLPDKAPLPSAAPSKPAGVPFVEREGEDSGAAEEVPRTRQKGTEYSPEQVAKAREHAEVHGSGKLVEFAKGVGMAPREAAKLLAMFQTN